MRHFPHHIGDYAAGRWFAFDPVHLPQFPACGAVYVVFFDGLPVYVGQSSNLRRRFFRHQIRYGYGKFTMTPWGHIPDTVKITAKAKFSVRYGDWAMWELRLIKRLRPRFNTAHNRDAA